MVPVAEADVENIDQKKLKHMLKERACKAYEAKEAEFPEPEHLREIERIALLKSIDERWMEHIDNMDRMMLKAIITSYGGGPVGLETLGALIGEEPVTIEDVYEPYLMQIGFLSRTPRGRCATKLAYDHLGIPFNASAGQQIQF